MSSGALLQRLSPTLKADLFFPNGNAVKFRTRVRGVQWVRGGAWGACEPKFFHFLVKAILPTSVIEGSDTGSADTYLNVDRVSIVAVNAFTISIAIIVRTGLLCPCWSSGNANEQHAY